MKKLSHILEQYFVARQNKLKQIIKDISGSTGLNFINLYGLIMKLIMISFNHQISSQEAVKLHKAMHQIFPGSEDYVLDDVNFSKHSNLASNDKKTF